MRSTRSYPSAAEARNQVRAHARTGVKSASMGGGEDQPFESAFSNLAHAYLSDKAPSLLSYEVGFQLVDKNTESTKAIGVAGFKVGSQWLYAPVFFLNGDLKGHELLYIKNQDMFVPMKENWLNYILNRKPTVLGHGISRDLTQVGVMPPHLSQLSKSPQKYASAPPLFTKLSDWAKAPVAAMAYWATTPVSSEPKYKDIPDLPTFLKEAGRGVIEALVETFRQYPRVKSAFDQFHDLSVVGDAIAAVRVREAEASSTSVLKTGSARCRMTPEGLRCYNDKPVPKKPTGSVLPDPAAAAPVSGEPGDTMGKIGAVAILSYAEVMHSGTQNGKGGKGLTAEERKKLLKDKVLVKDERPDHAVSRVYEVQTAMKLRTPDQTGLYDVLVKPGGFEKCLVVLGPYNNKRRATFCTVVRLDGEGGKTWLNTHPSNVWVKNDYERAEFEKYVRDLPGVSSLAESEAPVLLINEYGQATCPVEVDGELGGADATKAYDAHFHSHAQRGRAKYLPPNDDMPSYDMFGSSCGSCKLVLTGKEATELRISDGTLYVPEGFHKLTLKKGYGDGSDEPPIRPGDLTDIDNLIGQKTAALKVASTGGGDVSINGERPVPKLAALSDLILTHGLREKQARTVLARADAERVFRCRIKYADQYYAHQKSGPNAPSMPEPYAGADPMTGDDRPTMQPFEENVRVPDMSAMHTDREVYRPQGPPPDYQRGGGPPKPDSDAQQMAMHASQTGQKEIFDTAMIGGLLKAVRDDNLVDRYMGDLMKGMDRLARVLFLFYWHNEKFADRYGQSEMVELEDGLRNAFEAMGDIVLFLKQRSIDPHPDDMGNPDLGDIATN